MNTTPQPSPEQLSAIVRAVAAALEKKSERKLYSPNAAAVALDVSRSMVYMLMKSGALKFVLIGADRRIPAEEIERVQREGIKLPVDTKGDALL